MSCNICGKRANDQTADDLYWCVEHYEDILYLYAEKDNDETEYGVGYIFKDTMVVFPNESEQFIEKIKIDMKKPERCNKSLSEILENEKIIDEIDELAKNMNSIKPDDEE